jgi:hypothetical protein
MRIPSLDHLITHWGALAIERGFGNRLLVLHHELTHVLSIMGTIGTAIGALRAATLREVVTLRALQKPDVLGGAASQQARACMQTFARIAASERRTGRRRDPHRRMSLHVALAVSRMGQGGSVAALAL